MINFNPFDCELAHIDETKLNLLISNNIAESWYVEYKEAIPNDPKKLAKSISAFANAEGGWLFIGIKSDPKTNIAKEICGFSISPGSNISDSLSKSITGNVSPVPDFEMKIIELLNGNHVVIIQIQEGNEPPYITSSGTIHQREHNASNPVRDRYIIEKMYEKARTHHNEVEDFCMFEYGETKGQGDSNLSYLELFLFPLPFRSFNFKDFFESDFFIELSSIFFNGMTFSLEYENQKYQCSFSLSFNSAYSSFNSLILRPIKDNSIIYKGTTLELFANGNLKALIPIRSFTLQNVPGCYLDSCVIEYLLDRFSPYTEKFYPNFSYLPHRGQNDYEHHKTLERDHSEFSRWIELIDGHELALICLYIVTQYCSLLTNKQYTKKVIGCRARITNSWRKMMFFDDQDYYTSLKKYNVPITPKTDIEIPTFRNGNHLLLDIENYAFLTILEYIVEGIGIPRHERLNYFKILKRSIDSLKSV